jgi:hypothetical protein
MLLFVTLSTLGALALVAGTYYRDWNLVFTRKRADRLYWKAYHLDYERHDAMDD